MVSTAAALITNEWTNETALMVMVGGEAARKRRSYRDYFRAMVGLNLLEQRMSGRRRYYKPTKKLRIWAKKQPEWETAYAIVTDMMEPLRGEKP